METETETTVSTESREEESDVQSMLDWYVNVVTETIVEKP